MDPRRGEHKVGALLDGACASDDVCVPFVRGGEFADQQSGRGKLRTVRMWWRACDHVADGQGGDGAAGASSEFVPGLHSLGDLDPMRRYIVHFPQEKLIWSVGSVTAETAAREKKCFCVRIASVMGASRGWMAEHMLILGLESPEAK